MARPDHRCMERPTFGSPWSGLQRSIAAAALLWLVSAPLEANHFSRGAEEASRFGVHEVVLRGCPGAANPFDVPVFVTFTPPAGETEAVRVRAFHDGEGVWRARVYVSAVGFWKYQCEAPPEFQATPLSGRFVAKESTLRGRLLTDRRNPQQWQTDDGRWFLNLNDTAYFLLSSHDGAGHPIPDKDAQDYVTDVAAMGITSVRSFISSGPRGFLEKDGTDLHRWYDLFADERLEAMNVKELQTTDRRLIWMLDHHPEIYLQLILFPLGCRYAQDDAFWTQLAPEQKERVLRHLIARYAAFPQIFWLIANDVHYGPKHPRNNAFAREVGGYFLKHDPWRHPLSTGHARRVPFAFGDEEWATYVHLENEADLNATQFSPYAGLKKPVFLGEDRYEQDHGPSRDPADMPYFQRRLFWAWLLAGGSANYGGRWWVLHPYSQTGDRVPPPPRPKGPTFQAALRGLDSTPFIQKWFRDRRIELSEFAPCPDLLTDPDTSAGPGLKMMRRGGEEFLAYHPNAAVDGNQSTVHRERAARLRLDLQGAPGSFDVEWFRVRDGVSLSGPAIAGGDLEELVAPWVGEDVVLRLLKSPTPAN